MFYHRNYETAKLEAEFLPTKNGIRENALLKPQLHITTIFSSMTAKVSTAVTINKQNVV